MNAIDDLQRRLHDSHESADRLRQRIAALEADLSDARMVAKRSLEQWDADVDRLEARIAELEAAP